MTATRAHSMLLAMPQLTEYAQASIGFELARRRLAHRARRLEAARAALHDRARLYETDGERLPLPLRHAIADFSVAIAEVRRQLDSANAMPTGQLERRAA